VLGIAVEEGPRSGSAADRRRLTRDGPDRAGEGGVARVAREAGLGVEADQGLVRALVGVRVARVDQARTEEVVAERPAAAARRPAVRVVTVGGERGLVGGLAADTAASGRIEGSV